MLHYKKIVTAAAYCHAAEHCNVTPKVHLWRHVAKQMELPSELSRNREDWVEHYYQITNRQRIHFRTTKDKEARALVMTRSMQQYTNLRCGG